MEESRGRIDDIVIGAYCGSRVRKVASEGRGQGRPRLSCRGRCGGPSYSLVDVDVGPGCCDDNPHFTNIIHTQWHETMHEKLYLTQEYG